MLRLTYYVHVCGMDPCCHSSPCIDNETGTTAPHTLTVTSGTAAPLVLTVTPGVAAPHVLTITPGTIADYVLPVTPGTTEPMCRQ